MNSLAARLTLTVSLVLALSLTAFSTALYVAFSRALWEQFDERLANDARSFALMVEEPASGPWEFEAAVPDEFERPEAPAYFEVWLDDGSVLARSASLHGRDLAESTVPNGRFYRATLPPRPDTENPPPVPSGRRVTVAVARATTEVDATLSMLRLILAGAGLLTAVLAALAGALAVRRGLQPLGRLAADVAAVSPERLEARLPSGAIPSELAPVVGKLNELLGRLEQAFARERRFNADVSHELRTPLAGLRSVLEVAASKERSAAEYQQALRSGLEIVGQMHGLVESLLLLARMSAAKTPVETAPVPLQPLVDSGFAPHAERARRRKLTFENRIGADATVTSDEAKLRIIVGNLLGNAVDYTAEGGTIVVTSDLRQGCVLDVRDSGPQIPVVALGSVFDPFFRIDPSRTGGDHAGIGLSLVRAVCAALGWAVSAENLADGWVGFRVTREENP